MNNEYLFNFFIMIVIYLSSLLAMYLFYVSKKNIKFFNNIEKICIIKCPTTNCIKLVNWSRGENYFLSSEDDKQRTCLMTFWSLTHFLLYFILGYFLPNLWFEEFIIGIFFEFVEREGRCDDMLDIVYNGLGLALGWYFSPNRKK